MDSNSLPTEINSVSKSEPKSCPYKELDNPVIGIAKTAAKPNTKLKMLKRISIQV